MSRVLSVGYVLGFFLLLFEYGSAGTVLPSALYILIPLVAIWFPEELGAWLGFEGLGWLRGARPALLIQRVGWILLFLTPVLPLALG
jgi:hypothetical protein